MEPNDIQNLFGEGIGKIYKYTADLVDANSYAKEITIELVKILGHNNCSFVSLVGEDYYTIVFGEHELTNEKFEYIIDLIEPPVETIEENVSDSEPNVPLEGQPT